jgi:AraC-like DNA-binding protein
MNRSSGSTTQYYKAPFLDGVELLTAQHHTTPFPWHAHDTFTVSVVVAGTESLQLPTHQLYAPAGSISLTHPQEVHATPVRDRTGYSFLTFYLSPALLTQLAGGHQPYFPQRVLAAPALAARLQVAAQELPQAGAVGAAALVTALRELLRQHSRPADAQPLPAPPAPVLAIQQTLTDHLVDPPSLAQLARAYGWSTFQLLRYFKQHTGLTPYGYLVLQRIDMAKQLLTQGCPLAVTALEVGFYDQAHLTRFFRRFVGISPGVYQASRRP